MKEEMSRQNSNTHHTLHLFRWRPTFDSFRCYFQNFHKGFFSNSYVLYLRIMCLAQKIFEWCTENYSHKKGFRDSESINCCVFEKKIWLDFLSKKKVPTQRAEELLWVGVNTPLQTDTLMHNHFHSCAYNQHTRAHT